MITKLTGIPGIDKLLDRAKITRSLLETLDSSEFLVVTTCLNKEFKPFRVVTYNHTRFSKKVFFIQPGSFLEDTDQNHILGCTQRYLIVQRLT